MCEYVCVYVRVCENKYSVLPFMLSVFVYVPDSLKVLTCEKKCNDFCVYAIWLMCALTDKRTNKQEQTN